MEHKPDPREYLPSSHTHPLEDGPVIGHNLRIVHIHSEIVPPDWHRSDNIDETYTDEIGENEEKHLCGDEWEINLFEKSTVRLVGRKFDPVRPEALECCENLSMSEYTHNREDSEHTPDIVESEYPEYDECRYEFDETESEREEESEGTFFLVDTRYEPTECHIPETIGNEDDYKREEEVSENLQKQNQTTVGSSDETEVDETENHNMEESIESNRERRKRGLRFLGSHGDIFIDTIRHEYRDDIGYVSRPRFVMKTDPIIFEEDKE